MNNAAAIWSLGSLLIVVLGWVIYQVNGNTKTNRSHEGQISSLETNMEWIRSAIKKIAEKLDITGIG